MKRIGQAVRKPEGLPNSDSQSEQGEMAAQGQHCPPYLGAVA